MQVFWHIRTTDGTGAEKRNLQLMNFNPIQDTAIQWPLLTSQYQILTNWLDFSFLLQCRVANDRAVGYKG